MCPRLSGIAFSTIARTSRFMAVTAKLTGSRKTSATMALAPSPPGSSISSPSSILECGGPIVSYPGNFFDNLDNVYQVTPDRTFVPGLSDSITRHGISSNGRTNDTRPAASRISIFPGRFRHMPK